MIPSKIPFQVVMVTHRKSCGYISVVSWRNTPNLCFVASQLRLCLDTGTVCSILYLNKPGYAMLYAGMFQDFWHGENIFFYQLHACSKIHPPAQELQDRRMQRQLLHELEFLRQVFEVPWEGNGSRFSGSMATPRFFTCFLAEMELQICRWNICLGNAPKKPRPSLAC